MLGVAYFQGGIQFNLLILFEWFGLNLRIAGWSDQTHGPA